MDKTGRQANHVNAACILTLETLGNLEEDARTLESKIVFECNERRRLRRSNSEDTKLEQMAPRADTKCEGRPANGGVDRERPCHSTARRQSRMEPHRTAR